MRVALVYDRVNKWGGAERVLLALHELFPQAPLYTSVYDLSKASWARVFPQVIPSFLQKLAFLRGKHEYLAPLMPIAFESFIFDEFDLVISVTSEAAKGIITKPGTFHICYCLTPTRYLWSLQDFYFKGAFKKITQPLVSYLRSWDKVAAQRADLMVAISAAVQNRIKSYYDRDATIIYPPVETSHPFLDTAIHISVPSNFFLIVARLVPYKKVDLAVEVFNRLGYPLIIVGTGSQERSLRRLAKANIKFVGQLTDRDLALYYKKCRALIFPQEEDFGMVALEAQAWGKPVIAFAGGGARETVVPGKTGLFFEQQSLGSLEKTMISFQTMVFDPKDCIKNASFFSKARFKKQFLALVKKI